MWNTLGHVRQLNTSPKIAVFIHAMEILNAYSRTSITPYLAQIYRACSVASRKYISRKYIEVEKRL